MLDIISELSFYEKAALYIVIGLCTLFIALRAVLQSPFELEDVRERLGVFVFITVLAWPYSLICKIFSWHGWLMPVSEIIPIKKSDTINALAYYPGLVVLLFLLAEAMGLIEFRL